MAQNDGIIKKDNAGGGYVVLRYMATGFIKLNSTVVNSSLVILGANAAGEIVQDMHISHMWWNCANSVYFTVKRGANTVAVLSSGDELDAQERGVFLDSLGGEPQANLSVTKTGAGPSMVLLKVHKRGAVAGGSKY